MAEQDGPDPHAITTLADLEGVLGAAHPKVLSKHTTFLTPLIVEFISHARFFVLATADADGNCDSSPRGDLDSAVLVRDARTLVLPDRLGTSGSIRIGTSSPIRMWACCSWSRESTRSCG